MKKQDVIALVAIFLGYVWMAFWIVGTAPMNGMSR